MRDLDHRRFRASRYVREIAISFCLTATFYAHAQSPSPDPTDKVVYLDGGTISGNSYRNAALGLRYEFPDRWSVNDKATQQRAIAAQRQFIWTDDITEKHDEKARHCSRTLLFVTQHPEGMQVSGFNPMVLLAALDAKCAAGVTFPGTVNDHEAIQRVADQLGNYVKTLVVTSRSPTRVRAFVRDGHVMLEFLRSYGTYSHEPGTATNRIIESSTLLVQAGDYWVMWMLAADNETDLNRLLATKIFFDAEPAGASPRR